MRYYWNHLLSHFQGLHFVHVTLIPTRPQWQAVRAQETPNHISGALFSDVAHIVFVAHVCEIGYGHLFTVHDSPILPFSFTWSIITAMATRS